MNTPLQGEITVSDENIIANICLKINRKEIKTDINGMIKLVKEVSDVPCAVGFGISTPKQAEDVCKYADGAIVGSAIVRIVAEHGKESVPYVSQYVKEMKEAVRK